MANCDGDWEHAYGVVIETLDNPGWNLRVDLTETYLEAAAFTERQSKIADPLDWLVCKKENAQFVGYGGPHKLDELLQIFLDWAEANKPT